ncbi:MAG: hypothetical protein ACKO14_15285 [Armatimonadota bacterium]
MSKRAALNECELPVQVVRTIADLAEADDISEAHFAEAVQYRSIDRRLFG